MPSPPGKTESKTSKQFWCVRVSACSGKNKRSVCLSWSVDLTLCGSTWRSVGCPVGERLLRFEGMNQLADSHVKPDGLVRSLYMEVVTGS
jgi:hypothetical protein